MQRFLRATRRGAFQNVRAKWSLGSQRHFSNITPTACGLHVDRSLPPNFNKILIANRGEIAVRVMRTAKELGIKTVAVYSDADANSLHVSMADEAIHIGPATAAESYLRADKILEVCKATGAQAVHPGYGFLSENADFAEECAAHGVKFIGPPASSIRSMGSKSASKHIMIDANVSVVPGYHGDNQDEAHLLQEARKVGFPLMIKAVLGGGGKGMRIVRNEGEFDAMLAAAKREAMKSFKDDAVLLERYIERPRHIEFQVFADTEGNAVHLHERDCSVQRRHQKVLEEAPAPGMSSEMRAEMGEAAVNAAKAVGYVGAGTVEFIFDTDTNEYFFMEMNTRLQVEHPVTEMVMRRDLVQWQLHVAAGHPLPATQSEMASVGHAIEARIYAENPDNDFLPATGTLVHLATPAVQHDCRVETGVQEGDEVSIFYDPMIAKLIVSANDRASALKRLANALDEYQVVGLPTNIAFLKRCVVHDAFQTGKVETGFIEEFGEQLLVSSEATAAPHVTALATLFLLMQEAEQAALTTAPADAYSAWGDASSFRVNSSHARQITLNLAKTEQTLNVKVEHATSDGEFTVRIEDEAYPVRGHLAEDGSVVASVGGAAYRARVVQNGDSISVFVGGECTEFVVPRKVYGGGAGAGGQGGVAPMSGKVVKVSVAAGDAVEEGDPLVIMEAMKMEHVVAAPKAGVVAEVLYAVGDFVEGGKLVVSFSAEDEE